MSFAQLYSGRYEIAIDIAGTRPKSHSSDGSVDARVLLQQVPEDSNEAFLAEWLERT